ncbi:hypothetical protein ACLOJK_011036 [Asimina triloba]
MPVQLQWGILSVHSAIPPSGSPMESLKAFTASVSTTDFSSADFASDRTENIKNKNSGLENPVSGSDGRLRQHGRSWSSRFHASYCSLRLAINHAEAKRIVRGEQREEELTDMEQFCANFAPLLEENHKFLASIGMEKKMYRLKRCTALSESSNFRLNGPIRPTKERSASLRVGFSRTEMGPVRMTQSPSVAYDGRNSSSSSTRVTAHSFSELFAL